MSEELVRAKGVGIKSRHTATEPVRLWFDGANGTFETRE